MNKQNFLSFIYSSIVSDLLGVVDTILYDFTPVAPSDEYNSYREVAISLRQRPDIFRNLVVLTRFVYFVLDFDSHVMLSLDFSPKVSPFWSSNLFILKMFIYECKKNN